jgi:hypothetical protein
MKRLVFLLMVVLPGFHAGAQNVFKVGFLGGVNTSQVHGDMLSGFNKAGLIAGGFVKKEISDTWGVKFEILYTEKGSRKNARPDKGDVKFFLLRLNYAEIPLVLRFRHKKIVGELGLSEAFLVNHRQWDEVGEITHLNPVRKTETNLITGLAWQVRDNIEFNVRYTNSIFPVLKFDVPVYYTSRFYNLFNRGFYNNVLNFSIHYQLKAKNDQ